MDRPRRGRKLPILERSSRKDESTGANTQPLGGRRGHNAAHHAAFYFDPPLQFIEGREYLPMHETDQYDDGEVLRYGAGESYRPYNRSPRPGRSPVRDRDRERDRDRDRERDRDRDRDRERDRDRARTPPPASDSYIPGRSPRRRSRSGDRFGGRDRSRVGENWRRRDRSRSRPRSPPRRISPRRPSPRRSPPRFMSPRRDDRGMRPRSPMRRDFPPRDIRRRSRSPFLRDRGQRARSPLRRSPPTGPRIGSFRPRSRSLERREERFGAPNFRRSPPLRDSHNSSAMPSRSGSARSSPRPGSRRGREGYSRPVSPIRSPAVPAGAGNANTTLPSREMKPPPNEVTSTGFRSPPRGPAVRVPPTGPSAARNFPAPSGPARPDITSPTIPPAGPRGYVPTRGGYSARGNRGGWGMNNRGAPSVSPTIPPVGPSTIPTGPRGSISSGNATSSVSPAMGSKPFNPPTGPSSHLGSGNHNGPPPRPTLAQSLLANMPPIIPGGKADPSMTTMYTGVTKDLEPHQRKLKEEEERVREELKIKQERLRKSLRLWDRLERESKAWELKSELSGQSVQNISGDGSGGAAF